MQQDDADVEEARRTAAARRAQLLALTKAERLDLLAQLCLQARVLPPGR